MRLVAKGDCGDGQAEGKSVLCCQHSDLSFQPLGGAGKQGKAHPHLPPQSKHCNSCAASTEVDTWINFPADMWELLVSSVGILVNMIIFC